jgi:hypothetical protein
MSDCKSLARRKNSGFVNFPKSFDKRIIDGTARFRTKCDMLVGPCSCGGVHQENDGFVKELLQENNAQIDPINLTVADDGKVYMPRYWYKPRRHELCNVLSGHCACGEKHTANEAWVLWLLEQHGAKILGCPETALPPITHGNLEPVEAQEFSEDDGHCTCSDCERERRAADIRNRPRRNQI